MFIVYMDETGDDGFPKYSSEYFILTSLYFHFESWKPNFAKLKNLRKQLKDDYGFPIGLEFHTKDFLFNKNPYNQLFKNSVPQQADILAKYIECICDLDLKIINVIIDKQKILKPNYDVLDTALTYSVQRLENDITIKNSRNKYIIITDEGRVGKMRKVVRKMQVINYVPSKYSDKSRNIAIQGLIEDPLPKDSKESLFIQTVDLISYLSFLHVNPKWGKRISHSIDNSIVQKHLDTLTSANKLNLSASVNKYGFVIHPK
jgi:hypothetical protein